MKTPKYHLFICTSCSYVDKNGETCPKETAANFRANVKSMCKQEFDKNTLRVNSSGCLGQCEHGISSVLYPQGEWRVNLRAGDEEAVLERLREICAPK